MLRYRVADALRDAPFNLSSRKNRMNHAADFLQRDEIVDANLIRGHVHRHLGDVCRPRIRAVCITTIVFVVPLNAGRGLILADGSQCAELSNVRFTGRTEFFACVAAANETRLNQRLLQTERCGFDEFPDDHAGA